MLRRLLRYDPGWKMLPPTADAPREAIFLRFIGLTYLALFVVATIATVPHPALHGTGLVVLIALVTSVAGIFITSPRAELPEGRRIIGLLVIAVGSVLMAASQPKGLWEASPYFIGVVAALRLKPRDAIWVLGVSLGALAIVASTRNQPGAALSVVVGAVPWFLMMRLMRRVRDQNVELEASRASEARAAAENERSRVAREMHDVLAHSLSALALQLEATRLVADERGADPAVTKAIDRAHRLAAEGLEEARRAIGTLRGEALPGPDRLASLAEAFEDQTGVPVAVEMRGNAREVPPDAGLALYRTAQEALTNVRRHATPDRVELLLDYRDDATVLVVSDHGDRPARTNGSKGGYGLTGMRERAALLGGELLAAPASDGFRVELRLPA